MPTYKTPDVYIEEISIFPPSVAEVETAIPAFIGYTEKATGRSGESLTLKPTKIYSLKEYEAFFGFPDDDTITVDCTVDNVITTVHEPSPKYNMYFNIKMFFD